MDPAVDNHPKVENLEDSWDVYEAERAAVVGEKVAKRRRKFLQNLIEEDARNARDLEDTHVDKKINDDHIILEMEERWKYEGPFLHHGSFLDRGD